MNANVQQSAEGQGTETVFIACRIPNGLILELNRPGDDNYVRIELKGPHALDSLNGAGITEVPKAAWEAWYDAKGSSDLNPKLRGTYVNRTLPFIRNRSVHMCRSATDAQAVGIELMGERSGFEALDPEKQPAGLKIMEGTERATQSMRAANKGMKPPRMGQSPPPRSTI